MHFFVYSIFHINNDLNISSGTNLFMDTCKGFTIIRKQNHGSKYSGFNVHLPYNII